MIQIYCGEGKGKTTAAIGQAVRAAGRGKQVLIARFLKTDDSGEVSSLQKIPGITILPCEKIFGFTFRMTEEVKKNAAVYYEGRLEMALEQAVKRSFHMIVLDEIMAALEAGLVKEETLKTFLECKAADMEVVLTGRRPPQWLIDKADYISEIRNVRHPYDRGIGAREGIEY